MRCSALSLIAIQFGESQVHRAVCVSNVFVPVYFPAPALYGNTRAVHKITLLSFSYPLYLRSKQTKGEKSMVGTCLVLTAMMKGIL